MSVLRICEFVTKLIEIHQNVNGLFVDERERTWPEAMPIVISFVLVD